LEVAGNIQVGDTATSANRIDFGSASTRIQHNGDDNLVVFTNGAQHLKLDSSGNLALGIDGATSQSGRCFHVNGLDGGQARIHLTTSASGSAANEGSYIVALGAESAANAGILAFENRENRDILFSVGTTLAERFRVVQEENNTTKTYRGTQITGAITQNGVTKKLTARSNGVGAGIFGSFFGDRAQVGYVYAIKEGTNQYLIIACQKSNTAAGVATTVIANNTLAVLATNNGGTVTLTDTATDVKMFSEVFLAEWD